MGWLRRIFGGAGSVEEKQRLAEKSERLIQELQTTTALRKQEAWELGKTVGVRQISRLAKYLKDGSPEVRRAAMSSLEQQWPTGDALGIQLLIGTLCDPDPQIREISALALGEFIPAAKTFYARGQAAAAIQQLLGLLEKEDDEDVLKNAFASLGNIDGPELLPSFSETAQKLNKPKVYLGIRSISRLRPTTTRQRMVSALRGVEATVRQSTAPGDLRETSDYHGRKLDKSSAAVLAALEEQTGTRVPIVDNVIWNTYGAVVEDMNVVELGLYKKNLVSLPESICGLATLRVLWATDNRLEALPENFGKLRSLRELLIQGNALSTLPESIVNLEKLKFMRLDRRATAQVSKNVATWLKHQVEKVVWN